MLESSVMIVFMRHAFRNSKTKSGNEQVENMNKKMEARNTLCRVPFSKSHSASDFSFSFSSGLHSVLYVLHP